MIIPTEKIIWKKSGHTIEIVVSPQSLAISRDGKHLCTTGMFESAPAPMKAQGAVAVVGPIALTQERYDELLNTWNRVKAQHILLEPVDEFLRLEAALVVARENVRTHQDRPSSDPASAYVQEAKAEADLSAWIAAHKNDVSYQKEIERRKHLAGADRQASHLYHDGQLSE